MSVCPSVRKKKKKVVIFGNLKKNKILKKFKKIWVKVIFDGTRDSYGARIINVKRRTTSTEKKCV
jgi:hypothetical protein